MPGGFVPLISDATSERIRTICPTISMAEVESAFQFHSIVLNHDHQSGRAVRDKLSAIAEKAVWLRVELQTMPEESREALWDALGIEDGPMFKQAMIEGLTRLSGASREAHNSTEVIEGAPPSKRQAFVRTIAGIFTRAGIETTASRRGPLYAVVRLLLEDLRDCPSDVSKLISNALGKNPAKSG